MFHDEFNDLMALSTVPRWTIIPLTQRQSVAEHSYRVTIIALHLAESITEKVNMPGLMRWALIHDGPECKTGDIPTPFKSLMRDQIRIAEQQLCPWYKSAETYVRPLEMALVKLADTIEAVLYIRAYGHGDQIKEIEREMIERIKKELTNLKLKPVSMVVSSILGMAVRFDGFED